MQEGGEMLQVIEDILRNGGDIPPRVTNRMILEAVRVNFRVSSKNADAIRMNRECFNEAIYGKEDHPGIEPRLVAVEKHQASQVRMTWLVIGVIAAAIADIIVHLVV